MQAITNYEVVIFSGNSLGLENDSLVLKESLNKLYPDLRLTVLLGRESVTRKMWVLLTLLNRKITKKNVLFIHLEELQSKLLWLAEHHYLVPNHEWFRSHTEASFKRQQKVKLLCKTNEAMRVFFDFQERAHYLGFASLNRYKSEIAKDFSKILHLAGKSEQKGTLDIIAAWKKHPDWPMLTLKTSVEAHIQSAKSVANISIISENLSHQALLSMMNSHGVHLCTSETEGFGHYIVEALSTGAIVVTTNAAPMNELVFQEHGFLVDCQASYQQYRATGFKINELAFENTMHEIVSMPEDKLLALSEKAKKRYLEIKSNFEANIKAFFDSQIRLNKC